MDNEKRFFKAMVYSDGIRSEICDNCSWPNLHHGPIGECVGYEWDPPASPRREIEVGDRVLNPRQDAYVHGRVAWIDGDWIWIFYADRTVPGERMTLARKADLLKVGG